MSKDWGVKYLVFVSSLSVKMRKFSFLSLYNFEESVYIFQFLNDKMHLIILLMRFPKDFLSE